MREITLPYRTIAPIHRTQVLRTGFLFDVINDWGRVLLRARTWAEGLLSG